jgi:fructokinase
MMHLRYTVPGLQFTLRCYRFTCCRYRDYSYPREHCATKARKHNISQNNDPITFMSAVFICFGEVLWDNLPDGAVPGGAPMNVAVRLASLGHRSAIISSVGNDGHGERLLQFLRSRDVDTSYIQKHPSYPTGEVNVSVDAEGIPSYDIVSPSAWDGIGVTSDALSAVRNADGIIFGSLACRSSESQKTLFRLLEENPYAAFDVNLRTPYISLPLVDELMRHSDLIKLNDDELETVCGATGSIDLKTNILSLAERSGAEIICVTKGRDGAVVYANGEFIEHKAFSVPVADTVGCGDSFLAGFLSSMTGGGTLSQSLEFACALGALTATKHGANPEFSAQEIRDFLAQSQR